MRNLFYFIFITIATIFTFSSCEIFDQSLTVKYNTEIRVDTTVVPDDFELYEAAKGSFGLDIDGDTSVDVTFSVNSYITYKKTDTSINIDLKNNFEIAVQDAYVINKSDDNAYGIMETDSSQIIVPKAFDYNDTITDISNFTSNSIQITSYYKTERNLNYVTIKENIYWYDIGEHYIGLRNKQENIFCWIKVDIISHQEMKIISYYYTLNESMLIIDY